jgi:hypothetical protein
MHESGVPDGYAAVTDIPVSIATSDYGENFAFAAIDISAP